MSDDEDDPVVDEIPVYLSHTLAEQLYLFQYPCIPASNVAQFNIFKSQVKPENEEVKMEFGLPTESNNYDQEHGEQIAKAVDKDKPPNSKMFSMRMMDRIHLESSRVMCDSSNLGIGIMLGRELHISPIKSVLSLSPSYIHLDTPIPDEKPEEGNKVAEAVKAKIYPNSYAALLKKRQQEPWYNTTFFDNNTHQAQHERKMLRCDKKETISLCKEGYLEALVGGSDVGVSEGAGSVPLPSDVLSLSMLRELPLVERIKLVLKEVPASTLEQLTWIVGAQSDRVLQCLQQVAVLVQGNWVIRSDILYPKDSFSPHNGVPYDAMARARDYILYQLNEGKVLERKGLSAEVKIPAEELKEIMAQLAALKRNKQWHFRLPPDNQFLTKHPSIVEQQKLLWEAKYKQLMENFGFSSPKVSRRRRDTLVGEAALPNTLGRRRKNSSVSSESDPSEGVPSTRKKSSEDNPRRKR